MKNINKLTIDVVNVNEDIFEPPASPPPLYTIYLPEGYHNAGSQHSNDTADAPKKNKSVIRGSINNLTKTTCNKILKRNNLNALILNLLKRIWNQRIHLVHLLDSLVQVLKHNGLKKSIFIIFHFFHTHVLHYVVKQKFLVASVGVGVSVGMKRANLSYISHYILDHPKTILILMTSTFNQLSRLVLKNTTKLVKSSGGLDSILLAAVIIIITKTIQKSNTIF